MIQSKTNKRRVSFKYIAIVLVILLAASGGYMFWKSQNNGIKTTSSGIKLTEATKEERAESEQKKKELADAQAIAQENNNATSSLKQVTVVLANANQTMVNAYVSGVFEEGGTCTVTFTSGAKTLTKSANGFQNASNTQCAPISLEAGFLTPGSWNIVVSYNSATAKGVSSSQTIEVK